MRKALVWKLEDGKVAVIYERRVSAKSQGWEFTRLVRSKHPYGKTVKLIKARVAKEHARKQTCEKEVPCS
jgi:hypothetical protein